MSAFDALAAKLAQQKGVTNPGGLAAAIGNKKYGQPAMSQAAASKESVQAVLRQRRGRGK
jgi:hypothetical protein